MPRPLAACTIVSKNYLAFARVLARSFAEHHPEGRFFVLLVDRVDDHFDPADEPFELVTAEELPIPNLRAFLFRYTVLEANTAVKPFLLRYLLDRHALENIVYFDPDIRILGPLDALAEQVEQHNVVLTPHLDRPIDDGAFPGEQAILQAGAYNLGFVAFRAGDTARAVLDWWGARLLDRCVVRPAEGLFVDQKWMDLVPGLFDGVFIWRHPGHNVAYWNLHGRTVLRVDAGWQSNGEPLIFFHFSGIDPEHLVPVSKHQDRFVLDDLGKAVAALYRDYAEALFEAGHRTCRGWPYAFGRFSNGVAIPDVVRSLFHAAEGSPMAPEGDPFETFFESLVAPIDAVAGGSGWRTIHEWLFARWRDGRLDPKTRGTDRDAFLAWLAEYGRHAHRLPPELIGDLRGVRASAGWSPATLKRQAVHGARRLYRSDASRRLREGLKDRLGRETTRSLKAKLRPTPKPVADPPPIDLVEAFPGVQLIGYLDAETGVGESARSVARALAAAEIPHTLRSIDLGVVARREDERFVTSETATETTHGINLMVVNADQVPAVVEHLGPAVFEGRRNVGLWVWELDTFPTRFHDAFAPFDEIWTPSSFCVDTIGGVAPIPVRRLPWSIVAPSVEPDRQQLGWDDDAFVVLYLWNYLSVAERKNPWAAVESFRRAFGDDPTKRLVLKASQADHAPEAHARLLAMVGDAPNIEVVEGYVSRTEIDTMMASCDVYLSLHRSEGFGLTVAEAMALAKPVVATAYSGVTDFFGVGWGCPVGYDLIEVGPDAAPYPADDRWADPDVEQAAHALRRLADDPDERARIGERARRQIASTLSPAAVGELLRRRLATLVRDR